MNLFMLQILVVTAIAEIFGCYAFWAYFKLKKSIFLLIPGIFSLCLFAYLLTYIESEYAGRAYAFYGGIYILSSLFWMWFIEGNKPDQWDIIGSLICMIGALVILYAKR